MTNRICELCGKPWNRCKGHGRGSDPEPLNPLDYADDPGELEVQRELHRMGIENPPCPETCPECGGPLESGGGMVGEMIVWCPNNSCPKGILWEDAEDVIRRVI